MCWAVTFLPSITKPSRITWLAAAGLLKVMKVWATFWRGFLLEGFCIHMIWLIKLAGRSEVVSMSLWWSGSSVSRVIGMKLTLVLKLGSRI